MLGRRRYLGFVLFHSKNENPVIGTLVTEKGERVLHPRLEPAIHIT